MYSNEPLISEVPLLLWEIIIKDPHSVNKYSLYHVITVNIQNTRTHCKKGVKLRSDDSSLSDFHPGKQNRRRGNWKKNKDRLKEEGEERKKERYVETRSDHWVIVLFFNLIIYFFMGGFWQTLLPAHTVLSLIDFPLSLLC